MQTKPIFLFTLLLLSACSIPQFRPATGDDTAQVSFSSTMPGKPELTIGINCKSYQVSNDMIDNRKPTEPAKQIHNIPAGNVVTLFYRNAEIGEHKEVPVTKGDKRAGHYRVDMEQQLSPNICTSHIAFIPEKDTSYEISFGATTKNDCLIFIRQVVNSFTAKNKEFGKVTTTQIPVCN